MIQHMLNNLQANALVLALFIGFIVFYVIGCILWVRAGDRAQARATEEHRKMLERYRS